MSECHDFGSDSACGRSFSINISCSSNLFCSSNLSISTQSGHLFGLNRIGLCIGASIDRLHLQNFREHSTGYELAKTGQSGHSTYQGDGDN